MGIKATIKKAAGLLFAVILTCESVPAFAIDVDIHASIITRKAISVSVKSEMNFGEVTFEESNSGLIQLGTNGAVSLAGGNGLELGGAATAGKLAISGDSNSDVEISCENGGTLSDGGAGTLVLKNVEIAMNTGTGPGMAASCNGLGNTTLTHNLGGADDLLIGGALDISQSQITTEGAHTTLAAGGDPVTIRVVYQ